MNASMALAEWRRALLSLRAAQLLADNGIYPDAVARTYYAVLHAAKAALQVHDIGAESHSAVKRLFGLHLIKSGALEAELSSHLVEGLDERLAADYDPNVQVSEVEARDQCRRAAAFVERIRQYLTAQVLAMEEPDA